MLRSSALRPLRPVYNHVRFCQVQAESVDQTGKQKEEIPGFRASKIWAKPKSLTTKNSLKVIFLANTPKGQKGEVQWINKGYVRNYFLPRNEVAIATTENLNTYKELIEAVDLEEIARLNRLRKYKRRINKILVSIKRHEKSDGSPHAPCFRETIKHYLWRKHSIELEEDQIKLEDPISKWGEYLVPIDLGLGEILKVEVEFTSFKTKSKVASKE